MHLNAKRLLDPNSGRERYAPSSNSLSLPGAVQCRSHCMVTKVLYNLET